MYLIFRFLEYFSLMLTAWIMQVSVQVAGNQPLSDRWPQYIDWLNNLQWVDLRIFISPEWLFTGGKQRFTKAALWINPPSRKSHQRLVMTSGLWRPERKNTDPDPEPDPGPAPWVSRWRNEPWTNDIDLIWQLSSVQHYSHVSHVFIEDMLEDASNCCCFLHPEQFIAQIRFCHYPCFLIFSCRSDALFVTHTYKPASSYLL